MKLLVIIFLLSIPAVAQKPKARPAPKPTPQVTPTPKPTPVPCDLTIHNLPDVRGLKIGMTREQVKEKIPYLSFTNENNLGVSNAMFYFDRASALITDNPRQPEPLIGVERLDLDFLDGKLIDIEIIYDNSIQWDSVDEFVTKIKESLSLPEFINNDYNSTSNSEIRRELQCKDFSVKITIEYGYTLNIGYRIGKDEVERRRKELEEKKKKAFKP